MPTLGETLRSARERKRVTASQAAAATRMKIQHVEALERCDFSRMAAPIYAKGFIKIYAEYLGLDAGPLVREYEEIHMPKERPHLDIEVPASEEDQAPSGREKPKFDWARLLPYVQKWWAPLAGGAAVLIFFVLLVGLVKGCGARSEKSAAGTSVETVPMAALPLVRQPPEPYMEGTSPSAQKP